MHLRHQGHLRADESNVGCQGAHTSCNPANTILDYPFNKIIMGVFRILHD